MSIINRVLSEQFLGVFKVDFKNLIKIVNNSQGELDLAIRDDYLNLYYKGNSVAKISQKASGDYQVAIHGKFFEGTRADAPEYYKDRRMSGGYVNITLDEEKSPRRFLQKIHIDQFCSRVKKVNYSEEITFEQMLITDNMDREDLIIIDRQVSDNLIRNRLDLLALEQVKPGKNRYRFLVLEVKMGNNPELSGDVAGQLGLYLSHIKKHIEDYANCYKRQYTQKKELGLLSDARPETIKIEREVRGYVVVGGYSKMADASIETLKQTSQEIEVKKFEYRL